MNDQRRKQLKALVLELVDLRERVEAIHREEAEAFENMPEGFQTSERGQASEQAASDLDDALTAFDEIAAALEQAQGQT